MSARDKNRDFGAGPNGTLRDLEHAAEAPDDAAATQELAAKRPPLESPAGDVDEEKTGPRKKFDPYRFQANTVPPGMRAELLTAEPEEHPSALLQDTLPPNRSAPRAARSTFSELNDSGVHRAVAAQRPGLRPAALVSLSLAGIALSVLVIIAATRPRFRYPDAPTGVTMPSGTDTAPSGVETQPKGANTAPSSVEAAPNGAEPAPNAATAPDRTETVPSVSSAPKERSVTPAARRATTPPQKTAGPKSETPPRGAKNHQRVDLDSPLMP